jgi:hypothetical protein
MGTIEQEVTDKYAIYNSDCMEVMRDMPEGRVGLSVYSPPFGGLYCYSSSERDLSNCADYEEFFRHYAFIVREVNRITMPGRMSAVHVADVPTGNSGGDALLDFSGDVIRLHREEGWHYVARYSVWKEPLAVRNRTMRKDLAHKSVVDDSSRCSCAGADYLLIFRKKGENKSPIVHPVGLTEYAGSREIPSELIPFRGFKGNQIENKFSHWIWRNYASAFWDDVRIDRVLPFEKTKDEDDEKHVHPLQLDVIDRAIVLWSNPGEVVFTPFMGVGSEVFSAVANGRMGIGVELKPSYYKQATKNMRSATVKNPERQLSLV